MSEIIGAPDRFVGAAEWQHSRFLRLKPVRQKTTQFAVMRGVELDAHDQAYAINSLSQSGRQPAGECMKHNNQAFSRNLSVLRRINFIDSSVLGIHFDVYKIAILMAVDQSPALKEIGSNENFEYLRVSFLHPQRLLADLRYDHFPPAEIDGEFAHTDMGSFEFADLDLSEEGYGAGGVMRYRIALNLRVGKVSFTFSDLHIAVFEPEALAPK